MGRLNCIVLILYLGRPRCVVNESSLQCFPNNLVAGDVSRLNRWVSLTAVLCGEGRVLKVRVVELLCSLAYCAGFNGIHNSFIIGVYESGDPVNRVTA
jgi:hypothetical protein